ncbi:MAG: CusA/CzcA family heavy metal efflux RND transporter [Leptospirales bacterium]
MKRIIHAVIENRLLVIIFAVVLLVLSLWSLTRMRLDAIPDLSDTQVIIQAKYMGQPPQVVEDQVTYPLTTRMLSVPQAKTVRGYSFFGFSLVYILFEDGTDLYWARSRVLEYLNSMQGKLPQNVTLELGPDATSIGWIYEYAIRDNSGKHTLADIRDVQDFILRYELTSLDGVSEVASLGGFERQFQVEVNPDLLYQYEITTSQIETALKKSNMEMGARLFEHAETEYMVLIKGYIETVEEMKKIPIRVSNEGSVLRLGDIAQVKEGPQIRRGIADLDGKGEVVGGIVVMRQGEDVLKTISGVKTKLAELQKSLPEGMEIVTTYDRSVLINKAVENLAWKLIEELLVVSIITFIFLLHVRSALVALIVLPLGVLGAFLLMNIFGYPANIMSMGGIAIAIGVMVDASVVMVENVHKHIEQMREHKPDLVSEDYWQASKEAVTEVAGGLFWSMVIIVVSFFPVFALPEQSGRLFIPLALTKTFAMSMAALLAVVLMPVLVGYFIRGKIPSEKTHPISRFLIGIYKPVIHWALDHKLQLVNISIVVFIFSLIPIFGIPNPFAKDSKAGPFVKPIGSEFMPPLEEGDLLYMPTTLPGLSVSKAREILIKTDALIKEIPEVKQVFGKIGRADTATDPAPLTMIETTVLLKDKSEWRDGMTIHSIKQELEKHVVLPGLVNQWTMPIKTRIDMLSTGIKSPIGVKIMGNDIATLQRLATQLEGPLKKIDGVKSVFGERTRGGNYIIYEINRDRAGYYGLNVGDVHDVMSTALGGKKVTEIIKGPYRWSANIRYMRSYRDSLEKLKEIYIPLPNGKGQIPVSLIAKLKIEKGPPMIKTENSRKTSWLYIDTKESDIGSMVDKVRETIDSMIINQEIYWPPGYSYKISGQYEQMKIASDRMRVLIPLVIVIIFVILFIHFKDISNPLIVMGTALLFAPLGGLWLMFVSGYERSVASDVGFIALIGLAAETGVLLLVYLESALSKRIDIMQSPGNEIGKFAALREAVIEGSVLRVRPIMMTVITTMVGLFPLFWGDEPGNTAMRRIAAPMVGGLLTSTLVTLVLIPVIYEWFHKRKILKSKV